MARKYLKKKAAQIDASLDRADKAVLKVNGIAPDANGNAEVPSDFDEQAKETLNTLDINACRYKGTSEFVRGFNEKWQKEFEDNEQARVEAAAAIIQYKDKIDRVENYIASLNENIENLPEAQGVSAQVAKNKTDIQDLENRTEALEGVNDMLMGGMGADLFAYGVEWDITNSNPDTLRIGNTSMHKSLPIQSKMRGCIVNANGSVVKYLDSNDWTLETRDGSNGHVMVEIPEFYIRFEKDGNTRRVLMSEVKLDGFVKVPKQYIGAYQAAINRTTNTLASVVNNGANYRGGNNTSDWDDTYRSLLGMPATNMTLTDFRTAARKNKAGSEWNCMTWKAYQTLYWLFVVEYATRNTQKDFAPGLTADGYRNGGLGQGVSNLTSSRWESYNSTNPIIPCGYTDSLGNGSGALLFNFSPEQQSRYGTSINIYVPRYRGIENPFGHIWQWVDGTLVNVQSNADGGKSIVYECADPASFSDEIGTAYNQIGEEMRIGSYIKDIAFDGGSLICTSNNAAATTYFSDYHYADIPATGESTRGVMVGGAGYNGTSDGFVCSRTTEAPNKSFNNIGTRLCYIPQV